MFGDTLRGKDGVEVNTIDALAGKVVGVYFSAHWCVMAVGVRDGVRGCGNVGV
jgi:hypothetical protein